MTATTKSELAEELGVSRSSLYYQPKLPAKDEVLRERIELVWAEFPEYGHRRLALALGVNKKRIQRVMRMFNLKPRRRKRKSPFKPEDVGNLPTEFPNLIKRLCPLGPNVIWAADFTYIPWRGRWLYLATVLDLFSREIAGWHLLTVHTVALVKGALLDALRRQGVRPIYFHSDQGREYEARECTTLLDSLGTQISMSQKGSPWENGYQESFYSHFKHELGDSNRFQTLGELTAHIHYLIHRYNTKRIHITLRMPPQVFVKRYEERRSALTATNSVY